MEHHYAGSPCDIFNGILSWPILVMCANPTEPDGLAVPLYLSIKVFGGINSIIGVIRPDLDTRGGTLPLKS
jgi:hypothetical protein